MARDPWTRRYDYPMPRPRREDDEPIIRPTTPKPYRHVGAVKPKEKK